MITASAFAAHALVGCCVHHACQAQPAAIAFVEDHGDHNCLAEHGSHPHAPANEHDHSSDACDHATCSFVKAESLRIDSGNLSGSWMAITLPPPAAAVTQLLPVAGTAGKADFSSTQLYVWHCALLL